MAQIVRLAITLLALALAAWSWFALLPSWLAWLAAAVIFLVGGAIAEAAFRRLASPATIRADLEDRVRNPPP
jgi:hypothetical protein